MDRIRDYFRSPATGNGISGRTVSLRRLSDAVEIATTTTDANGRFSFGMSDVGFDTGKIYYAVDDGSGTFKRHAGDSYGQIGPVWWDAAVKMFGAFGKGVMSGYAVSADGSGMSVSVAAGIALTKDGIPVYSNSARSVTITAADATNPRIDRIVLRTTRIGQTNEGKVELIAVAGTPAASPTAPALTASAAADDLTLAQVLVDAGAVVIAAGKVTDERSLSGQEVLTIPLAVSALDGVTATAAELNILDGVTATAAELNALDGITATVAELNILDGVTATAAELNALDGITATVTELNYTDGVTSAIQTQLNAMMPKSGGTFTGNVSVNPGGLVTSDYLTTSGNSNLGTGNADITTVTGHFRVEGGVFTVAAGAAAGTGGSLAASRMKGTDQAGELQVVTGASGTSTGTLATVTFAEGRPDSDYLVWFQASSINAADLDLNVINRSTTGFTIRCNTAPGAGETLQIQFWVVEV